MKAKLFSIAICSLISLGGHAQGRILPVLEANTDVRNAGMGNTMMGNSDQHFIYGNSAAFVFSERRMSIDAGTEIYPKANDGRQMQYNLSGAYKLGDSRAVFGGVRYQGGIKVMSTNGS